MDDGSQSTVAPLPLRANFSWTFAGNVVYAASQWGIVVVLAQRLSAQALGRFALALAITAPIVLLTNLQLRAVQATDAREEFAFADYLALRLVTVAGTVVVIGAIAAAAGGQTGWVIALVGAAKCAEGLSDIGYGLLQHHERMDWIGRSMMLRGVASLLAIALAVVIGGSVVWAAVAMAASFGAVLAAYDRRQVTRMLAATGAGPPTPRWDASAMRRLAWLALPLGLAVSLVSLTTNLPRYVIDRELGAAELGVFAAIAYLVVAGTTVVTALGQAASPRLARHHAAGDRRAFVGLTGRLVAIGLAMGAVALTVSWLFGRPLLRLIYGDQYARLDVLLWLMAAAAAMFVAAFLGYAMTAARRFRPQLPLFAGTTAVAGLAAVLLVPELELRGAALALLIAALAQIGGSLAVLARALPERAGRPADHAPA